MKVKLPSGVVQITVDDVELFCAYELLIKQQGISPLSDMQKLVGVHYVHVSDNKIVSGLTVLYAHINQMFGAVCASIEMLVSKSKGDATELIEMVRFELALRKRTCFLVTQVARNYKATKFWAKTMPLNKEAKYLAFMLSNLDSRYKICIDTSFASLKL